MRTSHGVGRGSRHFSFRASTIITPTTTTTAQTAIAKMISSWLDASNAIFHVACPPSPTPTAMMLTAPGRIAARSPESPIQTIGAPIAANIEAMKTVVSPYAVE